MPISRMPQDSWQAEDEERSLLYDEDVLPFGVLHLNSERELMVGENTENVVEGLGGVIDRAPRFFKKEKRGLSIARVAARFLRTKLAPTFVRGDPAQQYSPGIAKLIHALGQIGYPLDIGSVPHFNDMPRLFVRNAVCEGAIGMGFNVDHDGAEMSAIYEAIERRVFGFPANDWIVSRVGGKLRGSVFPPELLSFFVIRRKENGSRVAADMNLFQNINHWAPGIDWLKRKKCWLPAQIVFYGFRPNDESAPDIGPATSNGNACGRTFEGAVVSALLELIERDAFIISWVRMIKPRRIPLDSLSRVDGGLGQFVDRLLRYRFDVNVLSLPTDFPVHVFCCVLRDASGIGPALTIGGGADVVGVRAMEKAIFEAAGLYVLQRLYNGEKHAPESVTAYTSDLDMDGRWKYWGYAPGVHRNADWFLSGNEVVPFEPSADFEKAEPRAILSMLSDSLRKKEFHIFLYTLPEDALRQLGFWPVRAIVPELVPLYLHEKDAPLHHPRLIAPPSEFGRPSAEQWNPHPHPFA